MEVRTIPNKGSAGILIGLFCEGGGRGGGEEYLPVVKVTMFQHQQLACSHECCSSYCCKD